MSKTSPKLHQKSALVQRFKQLVSLKAITTLLTGVATIVGLLFGISQFMRDKGGDISASLNGQEILNNEKINNVIFVDSKNTPIPDIFFPTLVNDKEYSVRDFFLQYDIQSANVNINHSDFYNAYNSGNKMSLRYKDNVLYSFTAVETPIVGISLKGDYASMDINMRATYDGISQPYVHEINNRFYIQPSLGNNRFDEWKNACKQRAIKSSKALKFNAYYITQNNFDYETIIPTSAIDNQPRQDDNASNQSNSADDNVASTSSPTSNPITEPNPRHDVTDKVEAPKQLEHENLENLPLNITAIDTVTNSDGTLIATLRFTPTGKNTTVYAVFDYVFLKQNPNKRHSSIFYVNIKPNDNYLKVGFSDYHNRYDKLKFAGFASEDNSLAQYIEITQPNSETMRFRNNSETPIGISYQSKDRFYGAFAIDADSYTTINHQLESISYLRVPTTEWRESSWQRFVYNADGSMTIWAVLLIIVIVFVVGFAIIYAGIILSDRYKFIDDHFEIVIVVVCGLLILAFCLLFG